MKKRNRRKNNGIRRRYLAAILFPCVFTALAVTAILRETEEAGAGETVGRIAAGADSKSGELPEAGASGASAEDFGEKESAVGEDAGGSGTKGSEQEEQEEGRGEQNEEEAPEVTLVMVGDILLHTPVAQSGRTDSGEYDFSGVFAEMKEEIQGADLALVNQEVIIGGEELGVSGYPAFNAPYELGDALAETGFDVVLHATNHALDKGKRGILNCLSFWRENYPEMGILGIHDNAAKGEEVYVCELDGIRIAILNYTYGTNGIGLPEDMPFAVDMLERDRVIQDLEKAGEAADFVIVCPHWGTEYTLEATAEQRSWAELFAENGADLVIGTHPHVIEPVEWVSAGEQSEFPAGAEPDSGENGEGTLVYYSLGNFVNWTSGTGKGVANRMVGGMARVRIGLDETGEAGILSYDVEPLVCHVEQGFGGVRVYPLAEYTEELAARNEIVGQDGDFSLEYCQELVNSVFGAIEE